MIRDLLFKFEQKVDNAIDLIELLHLQIEELEEKNKELAQDNLILRAEQEKWEEETMLLHAEQERWKNELTGLITRFDQIENHGTSTVSNACSVAFSSEEC